MYKLESAYNFGDVVYLRTDLEQREYLITGVHFRPNSVSYSISNCGVEFTVYPFEITNERNKLLALGVE